MKKIIYLITILLFSLVSLQHVFAIGQMTKPIIIEDVLRGQEVVDTLTLFNSEDKEATYFLKANGDIDGWATFYEIEDTKLENSITEIKLSAQSQVKAFVKFKVPDDVPNGEYSGEVVVMSGASESENKKDKVSVNVLEVIGRTVQITVTDKEIIDLEAQIIPLEYGIGRGEPLKIKIDYYNNGNVLMEPDVQLKILKDGVSIFNAIFPYPETEEAIKIRERKTMSYVEWQSAGQENGSYRAEVQILNNGKVIKEESFRFSIGYFKDDVWWISAVTFLGGGNMGLGWFVLGAMLLFIVVLANVLERKKLNFERVKVVFGNIRRLF